MSAPGPLPVRQLRIVLTYLLTTAFVSGMLVGLLIGLARQR